MGTMGTMAPWAMVTMVLRKWISILGLAPKAGEEATANRFTKFHKFLKRLDEIGYFSTNSTERSHEIS